MDDVRVGTTFRTIRIRKGYTQEALARRIGISRTALSRAEHGDLDPLPWRTLKSICLALEIRPDLMLRWRGGDLDRMLSARHSMLHESVARALQRDFPEWAQVPEMSFAIYSERGSIDLVLWHPGRRALLLIELKTDIVDAGEMLSTFDRKRRLAREIAEKRGWRPLSVSAWIIVGASRTNERRVAAHRSMLRPAYPATGREMRAWLRNPVGELAGLSMWPVLPPSTGAATAAGRQRAPRRRSVPAPESRGPTQPAAASESRGAGRETD